MRHLIPTLLCALMIMGASSCKHESLIANYEVIPMPRQVETASAEEDFMLTGKTVITYSPTEASLENEARHLQTYIKELTGRDLKIEQSEPKNGAINLCVENIEDNAEGYRINITPEMINISGTTPAGVFYGIQTLRKSIPAGHTGKADVKFPCAVITDYPRFAYRGAHFDVARHFFPTDSVKKFIDLLALHNINTFHWHLTDDQGWRVEIKKYPRLTEVGSKRPGTVMGHNTQEYDSIPVEGFFTQDEIKEIVKYAADRHITIVPEVDLPGHMQAALAAYPELGCTGGPYEVWRRWGVSEDVLCGGNDSVYVFIDDVLDEISGLFPGEYFHIGGDECPKVKWEECLKCQAKIKELGIKAEPGTPAEEKLQSHIMKHAEDFLASKGKKVIGWDEILEGGVSQNATIMSWRGEEGGIAAAEKGNDVIMTPNTYLYFDYYQTRDVENEPIAIGGYLPLEKVYSYEPVPESFTEEQAAHIKGVQANLWTEYIKDFPQAIYMELPRMAALSEIQWTAGDKDYDKFMDRLPGMMAHYKAGGYPYSLRAYDIQGEVVADPSDNTLSFSLTAPRGGEIYYTLDGSEPTRNSERYTTPVKTDKETRIKAMAVYPFGEGKTYRDSVFFNKATARPVTLLTKPAQKYSNPPTVLVDGQTGGENWHSNKWIGFNGTDAVAVIDLQEPVEINEVGVNTNVDTNAYVFDIRNFSVSVSDDGENWTQVATEAVPALEGQVRGIKHHNLKFNPVTSRYLKVALDAEKSIPGWHQAKGKPAFIFIDEISVI